MGLLTLSTTPELSIVRGLSHLLGAGIHRNGSITNRAGKIQSVAAREQNFWVGRLIHLAFGHSFMSNGALSYGLTEIFLI